MHGTASNGPIIHFLGSNSAGFRYYDETGKPLRMVGEHFDITERKKAERERMELSGRLINAQERERSRLARELHDDFSQRLAVLGRRLEKVAQSIEDSKPEVSKQLRELTDLSDNIGGDLHTLSHRLHSSGLEVLGLVQNVGPFCREFAKEHGIQVDSECTDVPQSTAPEITLCLYRIVQEGLRNVRKHSQASGVAVRLKGDSQSISLTLSDNGVGFELSDRYTSNGIGLQSMKERARMLSVSKQFGGGVWKSNVTPSGISSTYEESGGAERRTKVHQGTLNVPPMFPRFSRGKQISDLWDLRPRRHSERRLKHTNSAARMASRLDWALTPEPAICRLLQKPMQQKPAHLL